MNKAQQFQKTINEKLYPGGIPLDAGVNVILKRDPKITFTIVSMEGYGDDEKMWFSFDQSGTPKSKIQTILGKEIHLEDILRVLKKISYKLVPEGEEYFRDMFVPFGQVLIWHEAGDTIFIPLDMNLDDETIDRLLELIE